MTKVNGNVPAPVKPSFSIGNLKSGVSQVGSGGSAGNYFNIDHKTGKMTIGKDGEWVPGTKAAVRVESIRYGYYDFPASGAPDKSNMVAMITGKAKPVPNVPYANYPDAGPRDIVELAFNPMEGSYKGESIEFAPTSKSSQNRIGDLVDAIIRQSELPGGQAGFVHPVIEVFSDFWSGKYGDTHHFSYKLVDWLDDSGEILQSQWEGTPQVASEDTDAGPEGADDFLG